MRDKINVLSVECKENNELLLKIGADNALDNLKPSGTMLVDSDQFSFIYLAEKNNDDYTYIILNESIWGDMKTILEADDTKVYLSNGEEKIELVRFQEEILYLIDNIRGNSNYGDEMVGKVEAAF